MFEKSLTDLVKGIRAHKKDEAKYISACIKECRDELNQNDIEIKARRAWPTSAPHAIAPLCNLIAVQSNRCAI